MCNNERCCFSQITEYDESNGFCSACNDKLRNGYVEFICKECGKVFGIGRLLAGDAGNVLGICKDCSIEIKERSKLKEDKRL